MFQSEIIQFDNKARKIYDAYTGKNITTAFHSFLSKKNERGQAMKQLNILISHSAEEKDLAEAWKKLIETTSSRVITVWFSSDTDPMGGVTLGKEWREDLYQRLRDCDFVLAIQTPATAGKPWIMWECGVASGVGKERGIIPIIYSMDRGYLPNPLNVYQEYQGSDRSQVRQVCERLAREAGLTPPANVYNVPIRLYMNSVSLHRPRKPSLQTEEITLWRNRFENLVQSGRADELNTMRQMMYASLGKPVELTIHDTLGQLLLQQRDYKAALEETNYALTLAPDDISLLHRKALTLVELHDLNEAKKLVERIITLDKNLNMNPEIAALQGRIYREQWRLTHNPADLDAAIDAYYRAYQENPTSYYTGVNAAELAFIKGDLPQGKKIFEEVLATCQKLQNQPSSVHYWVDFSVGEAYLALGEVDKAIAEYQKGRNRIPVPGPRERESALKSVYRLDDAKRLPIGVLDRIKEILQ